MAVARINLEAQFWVDVGEVAARLGDYDKAVAQAVRLIKFGQECYTKRKPITHVEFLAKFSAGDALMPEFARREGDYVQVAGAENHFQWLSKKAEAGAKGGRSKTEAKTKHLKQNRSKNTEAATEAPPKQTEASSSFSFSKKKNNNRKIEFQNLEALLAAIPKSTQDNWATLYAPDFIDRELILAWNFYSVKPPTNLAGWSRALGGWLERTTKWAIRDGAKDLGASPYGGWEHLDGVP